jgi:hypothetical protein
MEAGGTAAAYYIGQPLLGWLGRGPGHAFIIWIGYSETCAELFNRHLSITG